MRMVTACISGSLLSHHLFILFFYFLSDLFLEKRMGEYLDALEKEIDFVAERYKDRVLDTIYIGGGTPTTLEAEELTRILNKLGKSFDLSHLKELTVESGRADSITYEKLLAMKEGGVTRISVNPQTMKQETLDLIGRKHTVEQVKEAFALAREAGFPI